jgi:hypothetical protein
VTGQKTYKEKENEQKRGRKRFIEREIETREAEKEIKDFQYEEHPNDFPDNDNNKGKF